MDCGYRLLEMARDAGFETAEDKRRAVTSNVDTESNALGMDIVPSEIMPEGWIGLRTEHGVTCIGPEGSFFVPAFDLALRLSTTQQEASE